MSSERPWQQTTKTDATETTISARAVVFGGVKVQGGTLGTVTVRASAAGTAIGGACNISAGNNNQGDINVMVTEKGFALAGLTVEFSSAMNGIILWRHTP